MDQAGQPSKQGMGSSSLNRISSRCDSTFQSLCTCSRGTTLVTRGRRWGPYWREMGQAGKEMGQKGREMGVEGKETEQAVREQPLSLAARE